MASNFYFSAWFPVLIQSVAMTLSAREAPLVSSHAAGEVVKLSGHETALPVNVIFPSGREVEANSGALSPLTEFGFHRLTHPNQEWEVGVSMFQTKETLSGLGKEVSSGEIRGVASGSPLAWWLTVLAMLVLMVESVLYHRRKVG